MAASDSAAKVQLSRVGSPANGEQQQQQQQQRQQQRQQEQAGGREDDEPSLSLSAHSLASSASSFADDIAAAKDDAQERKAMNSFNLVSPPAGRFQVDWRNIKVRP